ncbi:MAG: LarC family nickel insertion protein, partial [Nitrospirae bacterium]|nr:LarC family nickel insertion protein [Nitrospirota bacterium]
ACEGEITTPTAAAILTMLCKEFGPCPPLTLERVGYGAGERETSERPNLLRALLGETQGVLSTDRTVLIETTIDDMSPQLYEAVQARCHAAGALETWLTPVQMKKGRPGVVLSVLGEETRREALAAAIFEETTTIGLRISRPERRTLRREFREVSTPYGAVRVKVSADTSRVLTATPEYEDVRRLAEQAGVPVREVLSAAQAAARGLLGGPAKS